MKRSLMTGLTHLLFAFPAFLAVSSILAPLIQAVGWPSTANRLYSVLSYFCPQIPSHSLWLFGAPTGVSSRSLSLYIAFVAAGLLMFRQRRFLRLRSTLLFLIPIFADALTQFAGLRDSSNLLRVLTGAFAGIGLASLVIWAWLRLLGASVCWKMNLSGLSIFNRAIAGFLIVAFLGALFPYATAKGQVKLTIPEGSRVAVKTQESVSSESAKRGETVRFEVVRNVEVAGKVVIKAGAPATGEVVKVMSKRAIGREGELQVAIRYGTAVDGTQVPLRASLEEKGEERLVLSVVLAWVICPLFLLMKGHEALIPAGTEFTVFVDRPVEVAVQ